MESVDAYFMVLKFMDKYNEDMHSPDLSGLLGDFTQIHLAQAVFRLWLETLRDKLIEIGTLEKMEKTVDDELQIVPNTISIRAGDLYKALQAFLKKYNENLQSEDINTLIGEISQFQNAQRTYGIWIYSCKEALVEAAIYAEMSDSSVLNKGVE
jgi:hypothetical protein